MNYTFSIVDESSTYNGGVSTYKYYTLYITATGAGDGDVLIQKHSEFLIPSPYYIQSRTAHLCPDDYAYGGQYSNKIAGTYPSGLDYDSLPVIVGGFDLWADYDMPIPSVSPSGDPDRFKAYFRGYVTGLYNGSALLRHSVILRIPEDVRTQIKSALRLIGDAPNLAAIFTSSTNSVQFFYRPTADQANVAAAGGKCITWPSTRDAFFSTAISGGLVQMCNVNGTSFERGFSYSGNGGKFISESLSIFCEGDNTGQRHNGSTALRSDHVITTETVPTGDPPSVPYYNIRIQYQAFNGSYYQVESQNVTPRMRSVTIGGVSYDYYELYFADCNFTDTVYPGEYTRFIEWSNVISSTYYPVGCNYFPDLPNALSLHDNTLIPAIVWPYA